MISHHPTFELLKLYVQGNLPASLCAGINIHLDHCDKCQETVQHLTDQMAEIAFEENSTEQELNFMDMDLIQSGMLEDIFALDDDVEVSAKVKAETKTFEFKQQSYQLPDVIRNMEITAPTNLGKLSRARVALDEGEIHTSLLHIEPGGSVPQHTHKGYELTVLIDGTFSDEKGTYYPGDFIMLDSSHTHQPVSENGCLCYTVANDALHFTQGINKLLNPIGSFIY